MKTASFRNGLQTQFLVAVGVALLASGSIVRGAGATSVTVASGLRTIACLGSSDTIASTPLDWPPAFTGSGTPSTSGTVTKITFTSASFTASQFKYVSGTQSSTYFARITNGTKAGSFYTITDNDTTSVTLNLNGDSLAAVTSAVTVNIIPYWSLNMLFPNGTGVTASSGFSIATEILVPDTTDAGTDLAATSAYYYLTSTATWYNAADSTTANDTILYPDNFFTVRNNGSAATAFTVCGAVASTSLSIPLATSTSGKQDNPVAITRPVSVTLNDSGLISSGAFTASSGFTVSDQLLVFDNTVASFDKAATTVYLYVNGAWQKSGTTGDAGSDAPFTPGTGVIIRKAVSSTGASVTWTNPSTYQ